MKKQVTIGLLVAFAGLIGVIISQTAKFTKSYTEPSMSEFVAPMTYNVEDTKTKNSILYTGISLLAAGGILAGVGGLKKVK